VWQAPQRLSSRVAYGASKRFAGGGYRPQRICVYGEHAACLSDFGATNSECCPIRAVSAANPQRTYERLRDFSFVYCASRIRSTRIMRLNGFWLCG